MSHFINDYRKLSASTVVSHLVAELPGNAEVPLAAEEALVVSPQYLHRVTQVTASLSLAHLILHRPAKRKMVTGEEKVDGAR